jgi:hypothetical protein
MKPKNPFIKIGNLLGEQESFVSGNKFFYIDSAILTDANGENPKEFKQGVRVKWFCQDTHKTYRGRIEWLIITDYGSIEVSINNPNLGRLEIDELEIIK